jgi:uncharacterized protein (DUF1501 family)
MRCIKFTDWVKIKEEIAAPSVAAATMGSNNVDGELKKALTSNMDKGVDAQKKALKQMASKSNNPKEIAKISKVAQELDK